MMRLGLLGSDARIAEVAAAAVRRGDRLMAGFDVPGGSLGGLQVPPLGSWDRLLDAAVYDAVLVGADGWDDSRAQAVRTLVQAGRPLVLAQPLELSMLWAYELDMIRRDTGSLLVPCLPDRLHPFIMRLQEVIAATLAGVGDLGTVESLHFERRLIDRSRTTVLAQLSRDADLVRALAGDPARLSTLGGPDPDSAWSTLAVGLTGPTQLPVRWQVAPAGDPGLTIRLQATQGSIVIEAPDDASRPWTWAGVGADRVNFDRGATVLGMLDVARGNATDPAAALPAASWADAARAIELAETVPRSLARGRSIDLHHEEFTEMGTFRGTMASLGCGLIMLALMVIIFATLVAGVAREFGWSLVGTIADSWPAIVLGALGLFLLLQLLPLLIGATGRPPGADRET